MYTGGAYMTKIYGLELKAIKKMIGRNGEIFQANIYLENKKIGTYSQDFLGGSPNIHLDGYSYSKLEESVKSRYLQKDNKWRDKNKKLEHIDVLEETFENIYTLIEWEKLYKKEAKTRDLFQMIVLLEDYQYRVFFAKEKTNDNEINSLCDELTKVLNIQKNKVFIFKSINDFDYGDHIPLEDIKIS